MSMSIVKLEVIRICLGKSTHELETNRTFVLHLSGVSILYHYKVPSWFFETHWWCCNSKIRETSG